MLLPMQCLLPGHVLSAPQKTKTGLPMSRLASPALSMATRLSAATLASLPCKKASAMTTLETKPEKGRSVDLQEPQPRKLIVCCDGTWNRRDAPGASTNVAKMARALRAFDDGGNSQLIYYHPGVGTGNRVDHFLGGAFGVGLDGNLQSQYAFLVDNFNYGDQIFL